MSWFLAFEAEATALGVLIDLVELPEDLLEPRPLLLLTTLVGVLFEPPGAEDLAEAEALEPLALEELLDDLLEPRPLLLPAFFAGALLEPPGAKVLEPLRAISIVGMVAETELGAVNHAHSTDQFLHTEHFAC